MTKGGNKLPLGCTVVPTEKEGCALARSYAPLRPIRNLRYVDQKKGRQIEKIYSIENFVLF